MKKLKLWAVMAIALCALAMSPAATAEDLTDQEVKDAIALINQECPAEMGDGMILTSAYIADDGIYFKMLIDEDDQLIEEMQKMTAVLTESLLPEVKNDENFAQIIQYCKRKHIDLLMVMYNKNGKAANIRFPYDKL